MAPCLSSSPSGSGRRRLSELLEEKQEPFFLDLHLLEKGCSLTRLFLDDTSTAQLTCWPAGNDAAAFKRLVTSKKNDTTSRPGGKKKKERRQQQPAARILKLLLSKILRGKADDAGRPNNKPAALRFSGSFDNKAVGANNPAAVAPRVSCGDRFGGVKTAGEVKEEMKRCSGSGSDSDCYSYSDDDDEKQLSPVSVLEHPFESSPVVHKTLSPVNAKLSPSKNAMDVLRDLLDAAYSPALLTQLLTKSDDDLINYTPAAAAADYENDDDDCYYYHGAYRSTSPKNNIRYDDDAAYWEAHSAELARVSELVASEVPKSARLQGPGHADDLLLAEREDVGAGVADAVLEALLQELVADLGSC